MRVETWATNLDGEGWSEFGEACHDDEFIYYVIMLDILHKYTHRHAQTSKGQFDVFRSTCMPMAWYGWEWTRRGPLRSWMAFPTYLST